jgi:hypothetical protein
VLWADRWPARRRLPHGGLLLAQIGPTPTCFTRCRPTRPIPVGATMWVKGHRLRPGPCFSSTTLSVNAIFLTGADAEGVRQFDAVTGLVQFCGHCLLPRCLEPHAPASSCLPASEAHGAPARRRGTGVRPS